MSSRDPELFSHDIAWLIRESESALGLRGASTEPGNSVSPEAQSEALIVRLWRQSFPFGRPRPGEPANNAMERYRAAIAVWRKLDIESRNCLVVYYQQTKDLPQGAERLGAFAAVALWQAGRDGARALRLACSNGSGQLLVTAKARAEKAVRRAHRMVMQAEASEAERWAKAAP